MTLANNAMQPRMEEERTFVSGSVTKRGMLPSELESTLLEALVGQVRVDTADR